MLNVPYEPRPVRIIQMVRSLLLGVFVAGGAVLLFSSLGHSQVSSDAGVDGAVVPRSAGTFSETVGYFIEMCGNPSHAIGLMERELFHSIAMRERRAQESGAGSSQSQVGATGLVAGDAGVGSIRESLEELERADLRALNERRDLRIAYLRRLNDFVAGRFQHATLSELWDRDHGPFRLGLALSGGLLDFPEIMYILNTFRSGDLNVLQPRRGAGGVSAERVRDLTDPQITEMTQQVMSAYASKGGLFTGPYALNGNNCLCFILGSEGHGDGSSNSFFSLMNNPNQFRYTTDNWCAHVRQRLQVGARQQVRSLRSIPSRSARELEQLGHRAHLLNLRIHTPQPAQLAQTLGTPQERAQVVNGGLVSALTRAFLDGGQQENDEVLPSPSASDAGSPATTTTGAPTSEDNVLDPMRYVHED